VAQITARDLLPLVEKLSHDEQVRLAKLALRAAAAPSSQDADAYRTAPPAPEEFSTEDESLSWEAEGWDRIDAAR
jgi:hypothetical protein